MNIRHSGILPLLLLCATLALSGCESSQQKAQRYYESGMALLAAGDEERALVEFRNVFKYNDQHKLARQAYADTQLKRGAVADAYAQYLRLIEQYPDTPEVRQVLAEISIDNNDWDEADRHGRAAFALAPDVPGIMAVNAALDYRVAVLAGNTAAIPPTIATARDVLKSTPDNLVARRIVVDFLMNGEDPQSAMPDIEARLAIEPENLEFQVMKLQLLIAADNQPAVGEQLRQMNGLFPENERVRAGLVAWYIDQGDNDGAEAFLRKLADVAGEDPAPRLAVVQFLQQTAGDERAKTELDALIVASQGKPVADAYQSMRASIDFDAGRRDEAIAALKTLLASATASDQTRNIRVMLSRMLDTQGDHAGAEAEVARILSEDVTNVEALKLRASWLIAADKPGDAIIDLRTALDQSPRDTSILTLLATAHERDGSPELAGERLALAVETSGAGAEESLRYASFLIARGNDNAAAKKVLLDALKVSPGDVSLLASLGELLVREQDWARAQDTVTELRRKDDPLANRLADNIQNAILQGQQRTDESIAFLQDLIEKGDAGLSAVALIVQTQIRAGKSSEARTYLDQALVKTPDDPILRFLSANLYSLMGNYDVAEPIFRGLISEDANAEPAVQALYALLSIQGRKDEATAALDNALVNLPKSPTLRWMKAGERELAGDPEGAIAIYEALYADDSGNLVIANNLASLLASARTDAESLERAFIVARRLRGSDQPAFQDTYGWIAYRRGDFDQALANLEPAAQGLPDDPVVQMHLGLTYAALLRTEDARTALTQTLQLAGAKSPEPQFQPARDALAKLPDAPAP